MKNKNRFCHCVLVDSLRTRFYRINKVVFIKFYDTSAA